jgi:hypothetical protein
MGEGASFVDGERKMNIACDGKHALAWNQSRNYYFKSP